MALVFSALIIAFACRLAYQPYNPHEHAGRAFLMICIGVVGLVWLALCCIVDAAAPREPK